MNSDIMWLEPWWSTEDQSDEFNSTFKRQLDLEVNQGHSLYQLPVKLIGRGEGDDALFEILDGTGRVGIVHLTWSKSQQRSPWPFTQIYSSFSEWVTDRMYPDFYEYLGIDKPQTEFESKVINLAILNNDIKDFENWIYEHAELENEIGKDLYLELLSCDFSDVMNVLSVLNDWYTKRFPECNYDLRELHNQL